MQLDVRPEKVASFSQLLDTGHVQDLWSAYVADPYAAHLDLVGVSANDLSCISVDSRPPVLCVVSDSSLTVVGGSRRKKTYHRITEDVKSCKHQLGVDWVYAKDLWGKPLSVWVDAVEALVQRAQEECPDARIDVCLAWGGNEATGGSTQIVSPALGDPHQLVQDSKACMERLAALQNAGCRVALIGFGDTAWTSL